MKYNTKIILAGSLSVALVAAGLFLPLEKPEFWADLAQGGPRLFMTRVAPVPNVTPSPRASPSAIPREKLLSIAAQNSKENAELFLEMTRVVFQRDPVDRADFGNWVDTLNQGASLEGVYNGQIRSDEYRKLELTDRAASSEALRVFSEELTILKMQLIPVGEPTPLPPPGERVASYVKEYSTGTLNLLKRVLGEEALKVIEQEHEYPERLAHWYSKWLTHIIQRKVDFGVPLRNQLDENFHYQWAINNTEDRLKWEVLNRLHRVLNEANRLKQ